MFRAFPRRTLVLSVVPVLVAVLQSVNVVVHDLPVLYGSGFALVLVTCSVVVTRQQLAAFRTRTLEDNWLHRTE